MLPRSLNNPSILAVALKTLPLRNSQGDIPKEKLVEAAKRMGSADDAAALDGEVPFAKFAAAFKSEPTKALSGEGKAIGYGVKSADDKLAPMAFGARPLPIARREGNGGPT